jgi:beta-glucosidase/6-phospho-beta-glucosidase/beta-galactosidase
MSGIACDGYNKYKEDILRMIPLGFNCYRFSIEWSRIQPEKDEFNENEMNHYLDLINELLKHSNILLNNKRYQANHHPPSFYQSNLV